MNKILFLSIGVVVIAGLIVFAFWFVGSKQTPVTNSNGQVGFPVAGSVVQTQTNTSTTNGETSSVRNFLKDSTTVKDPINSGYYYLGYHMSEGISDSTATDSPPYIIEYISATQYFNIALLQEPIGTTRLAAEQYLMTHLGISQNQMCQLNYMVSVPNRVNSQYAGRNLGFSFCPGATKLPQ